jgi:hypothetical protein
MLDMIDWSKERPRHDELGRYVLDVQKAAPKTKFVYHVGSSGSNSMLKELFVTLSERGRYIWFKNHWISQKTEPLPISRSDRPETNNVQYQNHFYELFCAH